MKQMMHAGEESRRRCRPWLPWTVIVLVALVAGAGGSYLARGPESLVPPAHAASDQDPAEVAAALGKSFAEVADAVLPAVVTITSERVVTMDFGMGPSRSPFPDFFERFMPHLRDRTREPREFRQEALGSGVIVSQEGILLTANHVVENAERVKVLLSDDREFEAEVVGTDPSTDLAVLRLGDHGDLPWVPIGNSEKLKVGEWVLAMGNPFGPGLRGSVTAGIVSAKGRSGIGLTRYEDFIQTDAAINPGNSGGPLVNLHGEVIGINTAIATRTGGYQGVGFAIPIDLAATVMEAILTEGRMIRGWLGVYIRDLDPSLREAFGMDPQSTGGVLIQQVTEDSPAEEAGMRDGDVILSIDGRQVDDSEDLKLQVAAIPPQTEIEVSVLREGDRKTLDVTIGELEPEEEFAGAEPELDALEGLGFRVHDLNEEWRQELGVERDVDGIVVTEVTPGTPASDADLRELDVITHAQREPVNSIRQLRDAIDDLEAGDILLLKVVTQANRRFVAIRIPE